MARVEWTRYSGDDVEMVVAIMLLRERPRGAHMRPSRGDGGIDVITPRPGALPIIDQIKSFAAGNLTAGRKRQITSSLERVRVELSDEIGEWNLVLPMNHTREQLRWFQALESPFEKNWRGLTYLEGLVAKYPDVVDYYLHGRRDRIERQAADLLQLSSLRLDVANSADIDITVISKALAAASDATNGSDPHYRYEYRVGGDSAGGPSEQEGWVFSQTLGSPDGTAVTIDIFARFDQAIALRPIPMNVTLRPETTAEKTAVQKYFDYGTDVDIPADVEFPDGLPGGLPNPSGPARIRIKQHEPSDRPDIELRSVDQDNTTVSTLPIRITSSSRGQTGLRFRAMDGSGAIEVEASTSSEEGRASFTYSMHLDRLDGQPVRACLEVARFSASLRAPDRLALAFRHGGILGTSEPIVGPAFADDQGAVVSLLEDLSVLQDRCAVPLLWNGTEAADEQQDVRECAALLRGEAIEGTWSDFNAEMHADERSSIEAMTNQVALVYEREIRFQIFGQEFTIGTERVTLETAVPTIDATEPDGSFRARFTPGVSNRYVRSLLDY